MIALLSKKKMPVVAKRNMVVPEVGTKKLKGCTFDTQFGQVYEKFKKTIPRLLLRQYKDEYDSEEDASKDVAEMVDRALSWGEKRADRETFISLARCVESQFSKKEGICMQSESVCCGIVIMLQYALMVSEQTDELIPDMWKFMTELFTSEEARIAYHTIIKIASAEDPISRHIRRTILFGP